MDAKELEEHVDAVRSALDAHDPDPTRGDWLTHVRGIEAKLTDASWLLDHFGELADVIEARALERVGGQVLELVAAFAVLLACAQRHGEARALLQRVAQLAPAATKPVYAAAIDELSTYTRLVRARWLVYHDRLREGRALAATLRDAPAIFADLARLVERAPDASAGVPTNFTLNGFGTRLYFDSDRDAAGSVIRTRFVTALFVPILPIDAWRVTDAGEGYYVHGKVPLAPAMRIWQVAALVVVLGAIGGGMLVSWLDSPERELAHELEAIAAIEDSDPDEALQRLEVAAIRYSDLDDVDELIPIIERWLALVTRELPDPLTPDALGDALEIVARWEALPDRFHAPPLRDRMSATLLEWLDELGKADQAHVNARLELATAATRVAPNDPRIEQRLRDARLALAEHLAVEWPIEAILQYASLPGDPQAETRMLALLRSLPASPTLFVDIGPELRAWAGSGTRSDVQWALDLVAQGQALADDPQRRAMLERGDAAELEQALAAAPGDQVLVVALAELERSRGDLDAARARLQALGEPGQLTHAAQFLLASIEFDRGELEPAIELFSRMLTSRLPAFEASRRAYFGALEQLEAQLVAKAERGDAPTQFAARLNDRDQEVVRAAFGEWFTQELERSPTLPVLRETYMRRSDVVEVALSLGRVQLAASREASGEDQQRLLDAAERTFLSFRAEAEGLPDYHASLAQVYYRLGKHAESEAEFAILLGDPNPAVQVLAAAGQRELGRFEEARTIAEQVYAKAESPLRESIANLRATMSFDLEDRATWLARADASNPFVRANLLEVEGDRLRLAGKCSEADLKYAEAYEIALGEVEHGSSPNNAALLLLARHDCSGDTRHVDAAVSLLAEALAGQPDDPIVMHNYASVLELQLGLALIDELIDSEGLYIATNSVDVALHALLDSDEHDEMVAKLRASPQWRRLHDLLGRLEVLAPSMDDTFRSEFAWYEMLEDDEALRGLISRLERVDLDLSNRARAHGEHLSGESDKRVIEHIDADMAARAGSKPKTAEAKALLAYLDALSLQQRAQLRAGTSEALVDARASLAAFERAKTLWPAGPDDTGDALITEALLELVSEQPEFARVWKLHGREHVAVLLHTTLEEHGDLARVLAAKPNFQRGVALRATLPERRLGPYDLVLAELADDDTLRQRARARLRSEPAQLARRIEGMLDAYDPALAKVAAIVDGLSG